MKRNEDSANKIGKAFSGLTGIFKLFFKIIEPVGKFLINGIAKGLELVEKIVFKAMKTIARALELLGLERAAASMQVFTIIIEEAAEAAENEQAPGDDETADAEPAPAGAGEPADAAKPDVDEAPL